MRYISQFFQVLGKRQYQLDRYYINDELGTYIVSDGVGSSQYSGFLAELLVGNVGLYLSNINEFNQTEIVSVLDETVNFFNKKYEHELPVNVGCTLAFIKILKNDELIIGHIGDTRIYVLKGKDILYKSKDHNLAQEVDEDLRETLPDNTLKQLARRLTKAITPGTTVPELDLRSIVVPGNDFKFIICSDGVYTVSGFDDNIAKFNIESARRACEIYADDNATLVFVSSLKRFSLFNLFVVFLLIFICLPCFHLSNSPQAV
jgi:PPM family protein phosphatase